MVERVTVDPFGPEITREDVIYAAGFFDGEGCVNISKAVAQSKEPRYHFQIVLTNTDMAILKWYQDRWGGKIYKQRSDRSILIDNPRGCFKLMWSGWAASEVLAQWVPFLKVKQRVAQNALAFQLVKDQARPYIGRSTPHDLRVRMERFHDVHRSLMGREDSVIPDVAEEIDDQLIFASVRD
jgi:hypothetical protein